MRYMCYICVIKQTNKAWDADIIRTLSQLNTANIAKIRKPCLFIVIIKSNKDMKVTVEDILKIRPGKTRTFILSNPRECHSAVSLVCYVKKTRKPADISNYSTTTDWESNSISITAIGN